MKTTKIIAATLIFALASVFSSCLNSDDEPQSYTETQTLTGYYNQIFNIATQESTLAAGLGYQMVVDYGKCTVKLQMTGLRLPDGTSYPTLSFESLPFTIKDGWINIEQSEISPSASASSPLFTNFKIRMVYLSLDGTSQLRYPITDISYTVNNAYRIHSLPTEYVMYGKPRVVSGTGEVYEASSSDQALFIYTFDVTKMEAKIQIGGAKFAEAMPAMNMQFDGIPFTVSDDGVVTMTCEQLIPYIVGGDSSNQVLTPYPSFPISDLVGYYNPSYGMKLDFVCSMLNKEGVVMATYNTSVDTKIEITQ